MLEVDSGWGPRNSMMSVERGDSQKFTVSQWSTEMEVSLRRGGGIQNCVISE